jgi:hypothetical protein
VDVEAKMVEDALKRKPEGKPGGKLAPEQVTVGWWGGGYVCLCLCACYLCSFRCLFYHPPGVLLGLPHAVPSEAEAQAYCSVESERESGDGEMGTKGETDSVRFQGQGRRCFLFKKNPPE